MTFDGFDAAVLIEPAQVPSLLAPVETAVGPTLQDALAANRDALAADLWHSRTADTAASSHGELGAAGLRA